MSNILHHILSSRVDDDLLNFKLGLLRNILHSSLALGFLELERDSANRTLLNSLHKVSDETSDLVAESLRGNNGNLFRYLLVKLEVHGQLGVVLLNDVSGRSLDSLSADSSH